MTSIRETLRGKHLLLTGFTGFVAKVFAALLLDSVDEIGCITLLVRPREDESAEERVREIIERSPALRPLRERHGDGLRSFLDQRLEVLGGDAEKPHLGLDPRTLAELATRLDAVIHCAGVTDFSPDPIVALNVNVRGALHAADVAALTPSKRLIHISTCYVAGEIDGVIEERVTPGVSPNGTRFDTDAEMISLESACHAVDDREGGETLPAARRGRVEVGTRRARALGWPNLYTYSKGLAEHALARRGDLALTVVRPAIVECAREFPFPGWNEGLNTSGPLIWLCAGFAWKVPMRGENTFDVVPVDTVARGMVIALVRALQDRAEPVYQLASGDHNRLTLDRALDLTALKVRKGFSPTSVSGPERRLLTHLDTTPLNHGADRSKLLPAAKTASLWLRDRLRGFDADRHLPRAVDSETRDQIGQTIHALSLELNRTSKLLRSIEQLWKSYQPFVHDFDYRFVTRNVRSASSSLDDADRAELGWDLETLEWRNYWMDVEMPGLDRWSLPLLRGEEIEADPEWDLGGPVRSVHPRSLPSPQPDGRLALHAGDAE